MEDYNSCMLNSEKELLRYMLAAPESEIDSMIPSSLRECEIFLGLDRAYDYRVDYFPMVAKIRRQWAQAMVAEAMGQGANHGRV